MLSQKKLYDSVQRTGYDRDELAYIFKKLMKLSNDQR